jgi:hypothetical protein
VRDIQQLLREKEGSIEQIRREIEALRSVTMLLLDAAPKSPQFSCCEEPKTEPPVELGAALRTVAPMLVDEADEFDPEIRARLVEAAERDFNLSTANRISRHLRHMAGPLLGYNVRSQSDCRLK